VIVTHLSADNVLKYAHLELNGLPSEGLIGISGSNESGKSSIGETICFALFGRTFSLDETQVSKLIRWGESACAVTLGFQLGNGQCYEVNRHLDKNGGHGARLRLMNEASETNETIARGADAVTAKIQHLLGLGYAEFIESFYLAQREISAPHPHSDAVKSMAGVAPMAKLKKHYERELAEQKAAMLHADENHIRLQAELQALGHVAGETEVLQQHQQSLLKNAESCNDFAVKTLDRGREYLATLKASTNARQKRSRQRFFESVFLVLGAFAAILWLALNYFSAMPLLQSTQLWLTHSALWQGFLTLTPWGQDALVLLAGAAAIVAVLLMLAGGATRRALSDLPLQTDRYASFLQTSQEYRNEVLDLSLLLEKADAISSMIDETDSQQLRLRIARQQASQIDIRHAAETESAWYTELAELHKELADELQADINAAEQRARVAAGLHAEQAGHKQALEHSAHQLKVLKLATELLDGTTERLANAFNRELRHGTAEVLPTLTQNRYEHVKLDANLDVEVFSAEKGDFMSFDEVSSGTQRQVLLAVRLVMSRALARDSVKDKQFLFLDEPFAFFDAERTRAGLNALRQFVDLPQVWVIAQEFPAQADAVSRHVLCQAREQVLHA